VTTRPEHSIRYWQELTTADVPAIVARDPVLVLPLAATEQHGAHLPLSTDLEIGLGLLRTAFRALDEDFPCFALPPQAVGTSHEHLAFPGTLSLDAAVVSDLIQQQGAALAGCGVRRLVVSNSHGGNRHAIDHAALELRRRHGMLVIKASHFGFPRPDVGLPDAEWRHGLHGGAVETAMMLHLRPDLVRSPGPGTARSLGEDLEELLTHVRPDGRAAFAWMAGDLSSSGVTGNPALADAEMGRQLVEHFGSTLAAIIEDARAFPVDRLAPAARRY
jgi:creatinine amidohydrolase